MIFMILLSEKLLMYGGKFSRKDFFVSRQSFLLTNHGGRGIRELEKKSLKWRSSSTTIASVTVGMSNVLQFSSLSGLPKGAMQLRDIFKFTKPSLDAFRPFGLISRACQGPTDPPNSINVDFFVDAFCIPFCYRQQHIYVPYLCQNNY